MGERQLRAREMEFSCVLCLKKQCNLRNNTSNKLCRYDKAGQSTSLRRTVNVSRNETTDGVTPVCNSGVAMACGGVCGGVNHCTACCLSCCIPDRPAGTTACCIANCMAGCVSGCMAGCVAGSMASSMAGCIGGCIAGRRPSCRAGCGAV